jgi:DNA-binding CsgD family transcriptional regulator
VLADATAQLGYLALDEDPDQAAELFHEALTLRVDHGLRLYWIDSIEALALLAAKTNRPVDAARLIAAADAAREALGYPLPPADRGLRQQLTAALPPGGGSSAAGEPAVLDLEEAVAYVRRTRGARGRPSSGWASLTPTERDVVAAAVEGLTNPEIGTKLFMSRGTVKTHLAHIYAKLGVANRTELAALAAKRA